MKYKIQHTETKNILICSMGWILEEINRDRSDEWTDYTEEDYQEGLKEFTEYKFIGVVE